VEAGLPIYEYKCENGHIFDVMQKLSEEPLASCIKCGTPVRKILHPVSISFKGSGFYSTDYRGGGSEKTEFAKNGEKTTKAGGSESKSSSTEKAAGKQD
jgi:putative FmdB family regulatory protein